MKLTSELLTGVYEETEELRRLDIVTQNHEVLADIEALSQQIRGAMSMIDDLNVARESLEAVGYSTEWMDCINQDNNFMMVVKPDLQNFFGGDETKTAACEGAIIDTIKRWAKQVWEWIQKLFDKIIGFIKAFIQLWVRRRVDTKEAETKLNNCVNLIANKGKPNNLGKYFEDIKWRDPTALKNYIDSYRFLHTVMSNIWFDCIGVETKINGDGLASMGAFLPDAAAAAKREAVLNEYNEAGQRFDLFLAKRWMAASKLNSKLAKLFNSGIPDLEHNGFELTASKRTAPSQNGTNTLEGVVIGDIFTDDDHVPCIRVDLTNALMGKKAITDYLSRAQNTIEYARANAKLLMNNSVDLKSDKIPKVKSDRDKLIADPNVPPGDKRFEVYRIELHCMTIFGTLYAALSRNAVKIAECLEHHIRLVSTRLAAAERELAGDLRDGMTA